MRRSVISLLMLGAIGSGTAMLWLTDEARADHRRYRSRSRSSYGFYLGPGGYGFSYGRGYYPYFGGSRFFYYGPGYGYGPWDYGPGYGSYSWAPRTYIYERQVPVNVNPNEGREGSYLGRAQGAFRDGDYDQALRLAQHAAVDNADDGKLFLFLSQALLASDDYRGSADAAHRAMSLLEPKDWGYVVENFRRYYKNADYVEQILRLEKFVQENPEAAHARFLLGYHYGYLGYSKEAVRELSKAAELESRDELARRLIERFGGQAPARPQPKPRPAPAPPPEPEGQIPDSAKPEST